MRPLIGRPDDALEAEDALRHLDPEGAPRPRLPQLDECPADVLLAQRAGQVGIDGVEIVRDERQRARIRDPGEHDVERRRTQRRRDDAIAVRHDGEVRGQARRDHAKASGDAEDEIMLGLALEQEREGEPLELARI